MTVKELRSQLSSLDDDCDIKIKSPDGTSMMLADTTQEGHSFFLWADAQ